MSDKERKSKNFPFFLLGCEKSEKITKAHMSAEQIKAYNPKYGRVEAHN
jgi:hypothetical protein